MTNRTQPGSVRSFAHPATPGRVVHSDNDWLRQVVDAGLIGLVCVAPFVFGGRHDLGRLIVVSLIGVSATAWFLRQALRPTNVWKDTAAYSVLLLALGVVLLQIVPLPMSWINWFSPRDVRLLPLWQAGAEIGSFGNWQTVSIVPHETAKGLALLASYALMFVVVVQRIESLNDVAWLLRWVGISATAMAAFGLIQYFTANGLYFWFYEHPYRTTSGYLCGSFMNRNHFASFLVMGVVPLVAWLIDSLRQNAQKKSKERNGSAGMTNVVPLALLCAVAIVLFAILLSLSRGGALALLTTIVVAGGIYARSGVVESKYCAMFLGLAIAVVTLLSLYGYDIVARRLNTLAKGSIDAMDNHHGRRKIWNANIDAFRDGGLLGAGVGTHSSIYPVYLPQSLRGEYTHAESGYLQVATENGVIGVMLLASAIGLCGAWCVTSLRYGRSDQERLWIGAVASGLAASAVHSIVDFVWYIPACICVTIVLAACALRLAQLAKRDSAGAIPALHPARVPVLAYRLATPLVGVLSLWAVWTYVGPARASIHWDRYLRVDVASRDLTRDSLARFAENQQQRPTAEADRAAILDAMLRHLRSVVDCDPHFAPARFKLALHLANEFERRQQSNVNAMAIDQISDAAMSSQFESAADVHDWLQRAFGDDRQLLAEALVQVRAGLACSPFEGKGYQLLSKLCFLEGQSRSHAAAYIAQGLRVRPYDGDLLFAVGRVSLLNGDLATAMQYWQKCFRDAGAHQLKIVSLMAGEVPANIFVEAFEPDWHTLPQIWTRYRELKEPQDLIDLVAYSARVTERGVPPESNLSLDAIWLGQATMYRDLKRTAEQLACLQEAYRANPHGFEVRYQLAHALLESHRYAEAEPHFRWCLARRPEQKELGIALAQITERRRAERDPSYQSQSGIARAWEN